MARVATASVWNASREGVKVLEGDVYGRLRLLRKGLSRSDGSKRYSSLGIYLISYLNTICQVLFIITTAKSHKYA